MLLCLHVEFVFMLKDNPPSKLRLSISSAQICLFCEKYENPRNLGIVRACADKSHLCLTKSVPRGFLKVMLLEKVIKFSFLLIAIIRYFTLSSKQIISILRKFLSSSSHQIVNLDWNRILPWKSEDFLQVTDPTYSDMLSRCYKAFYVSLI